jgi:flavin-binding protein dodecin
MKNRILLICFCLFTAIASKAQQDLMMFNFNEIPQSSYSNPSNQFNGKFYLGLPLISSSYFSLSNSGFAYSDLIKKDGDSLKLDFNSMIGELQDKNFLSLNSKVDLFSLGFKVGDRTQITLNATENINFRFRYTKDFATFVQKGNLGFENNVANFDNIGFSANYYREYGLGVSHQFSSRLRLGAKVKYLYGIANLDSRRTNLSLTTDPNTFALNAKADVLINSSAGEFSADSLSEMEGFISGFDNTGFGVDLGFNYELTKKLSINASILDLGYIQWNSNVTNYTIDKGEYTFTGIPVDAFSPQNDTSGSSAFSNVIDSLETAFNVKETSNGYTTPLVGRFYAGVNYKMNEKLMLGGLIQSEFYKGSVRPSLTASANYKISKWLGVAASYSVINRSYTNLGVGININPRNIQIYVVSDNILGALNPQHAGHAQVRAGVNFIFGSEKVNEINPSYDGVTNVKREKRSRRNAEEDATQPSTPVTPVVPEVPQTDTIVSPIPTEKVDSIIENTTDTVKQKVETPKSGEGKTIIEAVEKNQEKIKAKADSAANFGKPMIHPVAPETKQDSSSKEVKSEAKQLKKGNEKAANDAIKKANMTSDSINENTTDSVKQEVETPKAGKGEAVIEAVEGNQEKIKAKSDSAANFGKPMIHPVAPETKQDSSSKEVKSEAKQLKKGNEKAANDAIKKANMTSDSINENTTDSVKQEVETPKAGKGEAVIEAVEGNQEKTKSDSAANFGKPMIHPVAPETKQDSSSKEVKSEEKQLKKGNEKAANDAIKKANMTSDSINENTTDSVKQEVETPKAGKGETNIKAVEGNQEKMEETADSTSNIGKPIIQKIAPNSKTDSSLKRLEKGLGKNQLSPAAEALRKEVNESIENTKAAEKMKADTIPEPVQSPSKEEPNK